MADWAKSGFIPAVLLPRKEGVVANGLCHSHHVVLMMCLRAVEIPLDTGVHPSGESCGATTSASSTSTCEVRWGLFSLPSLCQSAWAVILVFFSQLQALSSLLEPKDGELGGYFIFMQGSSCCHLHSASHIIAPVNDNFPVFLQVS